MSAVPQALAAPAVCQALASPRFELIPIKGMLDQASALVPGARVSVTCSPKLGLDRTLQAARELRSRGFEPVPHVAARLVRDRGHLQELLSQMAGLGVADAFIVGGDSPQPAGTFGNALELLRAIEDSGLRPPRLGIPCYPEGHGTIPWRSLEQALHAKAGHADYMVSQICFQPERIAEWLQRTRDDGLRLPVYVGLPGVINARELLAIAVRIGLGASSRLLRRNSAMVGRLLGPEYRADDLIWGLVEPLGGSGFAGFHINTFNRVAATEQWRGQMLESLRAWYGDACFHPEPPPAARGDPVAPAQRPANPA